MTIENQIIVLNPEYRIKNDIKRCILFKASTDPLEKEGISDFSGLLHPVYAILFCLMDGKKQVSQVVDEFSHITGMKNSDIWNLVMPLIENKDILRINYDSHCYHFPQNILIEKKDGISVPQYDYEEFLIPRRELELKNWRLYQPLDALFMINTLCVTDCIYCYADRSRLQNCSIHFSRIKELIREAKELKMRSFDISGGEFFLYKKWDQLLSELVLNGFKPYLSTKMPLERSVLERVKDLGINKIQISIDSIDDNELTRILNVDDSYGQRLKQTFGHLKDLDFSVYTNSQVNSVNQDNFTSLIDYLLEFENLKRLTVGAAGFSLYRPGTSYIQYRPNLDAMKRIEEYVETKKNNRRGIPVNVSGFVLKEDYHENKTQKSFDERARCTGNFSGFFILPDGKVTVCEELYWHPKFLLGDLTKQSIKEMWSSERAVGLYRISQDHISDESACKTCPEFEQCHQHSGVCWKEVLYAYGNDKWDYPPPSCPKSPPPYRVIWAE